MKALQHPNASTASNLITSQLRAWNLINESFNYLIERWKQASKDLRNTSFESSDDDKTQATGTAFGKSYKVVLSSAFIGAKLHGRVSVILTNPRVGDPVIVCEFLVGPHGEYLTTEGEVLVEHPDSMQEYQLIVEVITKVIAA